MLAFLPKWLLGCIASILFAINSVIWLTLIFVFAIIKAIPFKPLRQRVNLLLDFFATGWTTGNSAIQNFTIATEWDVEGLGQLTKKEWYMIIANHQSWVDIFVLQRVLNGKVPFIKFFLKKELLWVPFFGLAWWALDFPFMVRYTRKFIRKHPHLKGKDVETTRKACEKFRYKPVSVMNFVEGTRLTQKKHDSQQSLYRHLLKPKAGGTGFVLGAMHDSLHKIIDVTIYYPDGIPTFWQLLSGQIRKVVVRVNVLPIESQMIGDYDADKEYRKEIQRYLNDLWVGKDQLLDQLKTENDERRSDA
ncbi:MAG: 1-acyl-sn-glycerol-3-phosphate acyltransferase [Phenylobacterium sp.]|jgi:1-acyl-sn-glycerol-3-phosphate acyltransferase